MCGVCLPLCPPVVSLGQILLGPLPLHRGMRVRGCRLQQAKEAGRREGSPASAWMRANLPLSLFPNPQESVSSSGTPHKRDSFIYSTWLEDSVSTTSGGSSPGTRPQAASPAKPLLQQEGDRDGHRGQRPLLIPQVVGV